MVLNEAASVGMPASGSASDRVAMPTLDMPAMPQLILMMFDVV